MHWVCNALNHTAVTVNPGNKSSNEMWYGTVVPDSPHPFRRTAYCRWKRPSKSHPRVESCFGPGIDHPSDSLRMLTPTNKVVETRGVTWEATLRTGASSSRLPDMPEHGGTIDLEEVPQPGGTHGYQSAPLTPLPVLGRGIPHQRKRTAIFKPNGVGKRFANGQQRTARQ